MIVTMTAGTTKLLPRIAMLLAAAALSACASSGGQQPRITLEQDLAVGFGSSLFDLQELSSLDRSSQAGVDHVQVAMYRVSPVNGQHQFPDSVFSRTLARHGAQLTWQRIVKLRENGQQIWVFAGMDLDALRLETVCVFVLEQGEDDAAATVQNERPAEPGIAAMLLPPS